MGQSIVVTAKPSSNPGIVRFETNRALTGMGHDGMLGAEKIAEAQAEAPAAEDVEDEAPAAEVAAEPVDRVVDTTGAGDLYAAGSLADGIARWDGVAWRRLGAGIIAEE